MTNLTCATRSLSRASLHSSGYERWQPLHHVAKKSARGGEGGCAGGQATATRRRRPRTDDHEPLAARDCSNSSSKCTSTHSLLLPPLVGPTVHASLDSSLSSNESLVVHSFLFDKAASRWEAVLGGGGAAIWAWPTALATVELVCSHASGSTPNTFPRARIPRLPLTSAHWRAVQFLDGPARIVSFFKRWCHFSGLCSARLCGVQRAARSAACAWRTCPGSSAPVWCWRAAIMRMWGTSRLSRNLELLVQLKGRDSKQNGMTERNYC